MSVEPLPSRTVLCANLGRFQAVLRNIAKHAPLEDTTTSQGPPLIQAVCIARQGNTIHITGELCAKIAQKTHI